MGAGVGVRGGDLVCPPPSACYVLTLRFGNAFTFRPAPPIAQSCYVPVLTCHIGLFARTGGVNNLTKSVLSLRVPIKTLTPRRYLIRALSVILLLYVKPIKEGHFF